MSDSMGGSVPTPPSIHSDLASRALEHLRSSGVYEDQEGNPVTGTVPGRQSTSERPTYDSVMASSTSNQTVSSSKSNYQFARGTTQPSMKSRVGGILQKGVLVLVVVGALGGLVYAAQNYPPLSAYLPWNKSAEVDPQALYSQKRYEEVLSILQAKKDQNKLSKLETDLLGKVYVQLAKQDAKDKRYDDAIGLLQQVPKGCTSAKDARELLKRYRQILDKTQ
jgi:hypothetical protein